LIFATIASVLIPARAVDLFEFADDGRHYVFTVASPAPVPASVDQEQAARARAAVGP